MKKDFIPVFRFVICSDAHIEGIGSPGYNRLKKTVVYSLDFASKCERYKNIDSFFIAGDITNKGSKEEFDAISRLAKVYCERGEEAFRDSCAAEQVSEEIALAAEDVAAKRLAAQKKYAK